MTTASTPFRDKSAALTGASQAVFADVGYQGCEERFIANPSATADLWVNPFGNAAVVNGQGSFLLAPGGYWSSKGTNAVNVIGTAAEAVTAGER